MYRRDFCSEQNLQSWWDKSGMKGGTIGLLKVVVELMLNAAECPMVRVGHASPFLFNDRFLASDSQQRVAKAPVHFFRKLSFEMDFLIAPSGLTNGRNGREADIRVGRPERQRQAE